MEIYLAKSKIINKNLVFNISYALASLRDIFRKNIAKGICAKYQKKQILATTNQTINILQRRFYQQEQVCSMYLQGV